MLLNVVLLFDEAGVLRFTNFMAQENAAQFRLNPTLPLLYDSGVVYRVEEVETWSDVTSTYAAGHEDCDSLGPIRAGEILARGAAAIQKGDPGYEAVQRLKPRQIHAETMLTTRTVKGQVGGYHCLARYLIGGVWYQDDPSARLGMRRSGIDPVVLARWRRLGVRPMTTPLPA